MENRDEHRKATVDDETDVEWLHKQIKEHKKIKAIQAKVDSATAEMAKNIEKTEERGEQATALQQQADTLQVKAKEFQKKSKQLERRMWLKALKWKIIMWIVVIAVVGGAIMLVLQSTGLSNLFK